MIRLIIFGLLELFTLGLFWQGLRLAKKVGANDVQVKMMKATAWLIKGLAEESPKLNNKGLVDLQFKILMDLQAMVFDEQLQQIYAAKYDNFYKEASDAKQRRIAGDFNQT